MTHLIKPTLTAPNTRRIKAEVLSVSERGRYSTHTQSVRSKAVFTKLTGEFTPHASVPMPSPPSDWLVCCMLKTSVVFTVGDFRVNNSQSEGNRNRFGIYGNCSWFTGTDTSVLETALRSICNVVVMFRCRGDSATQNQSHSGCCSLGFFWIIIADAFT